MYEFLDYNSTIMVYNMGLIFGILCMFPPIWVLGWFLGEIKHKHKVFKSLYMFIQSSFMFSGFIRFLIEGSLELYLLSFINIMDIRLTKAGHILSFALAVGVLVFVTAGVVLGAIVMIRKKEKLDLAAPAVGGLYHGLDSKSNINLLFHVIFLAHPVPTCQTAWESPWAP